MKRLMTTTFILVFFAALDVAAAYISDSPASAASLGLKHGDVVMLRCHDPRAAVWLDGQVPNGNALVNQDKSASGTRWQLEVLGDGKIFKLRNLGNAPAGSRQFRYLSTEKPVNPPGQGAPFLVEKNTESESAWHFHTAGLIEATKKEVRGIAINSVTKPLEWLRCRPGVPDVDFGYAKGTFEPRLLWHISKPPK